MVTDQIIGDRIKQLSPISYITAHMNDANLSIIGQCDGKSTSHKVLKEHPA